MKLAPVRLLEKREARLIADDRIKALVMPKPPEEKGAMPFSAFAAEKFIPWAIQTKISWQQYRGKEPEQTPLGPAVRFFGDKPLRDIAGDAVKDFGLYVAQRLIGGRPVKDRTVNGYLKNLRHVFNKAIEWGDAAANPVAKFKFAKEDRQKSAGRILETDEEQNKLLGALPAWLRLLVALALETAARRGDLVKLTWRSVHPDYVEFLETKECKHRRTRGTSSRSCE